MRQVYTLIGGKRATLIGDFVDGSAKGKSSNGEDEDYEA